MRRRLRSRVWEIEIFKTLEEEEKTEKEQQFRITRGEKRVKNQRRLMLTGISSFWADKSALK